MAKGALPLKNSTSENCRYQNIDILGEYIKRKKQERVDQLKKAFGISLLMCVVFFSYALVTKDIDKMLMAVLAVCLVWYMRLCMTEEVKESDTFLRGNDNYVTDDRMMLNAKRDAMFDRMADMEVVKSGRVENRNNQEELDNSAETAV